MALGRLNPNGTVDSTFSTTVFNTPAGYYSSTARAQALAVQPDGKIMVGGRLELTPYVGPSRLTGSLYRLNTNGAQDATFSAGAVNGPVVTLALQPDGKVLAGGLFTNVRNQTRNHIVRLNADGTLDTSFNPNCNGNVFCIALQADGRILVGGVFTSMGGGGRTNLARLNADGTLDSSFVAGTDAGAMSYVESLAVQADGRIMVAGGFKSLAGGARSNVGRLNPDGTLDGSYAPSVNGEVYGIAPQPDGKLLLAGMFTSVGGQPRGRLARLSATEPAAESLTSDGFTVSWQRGGTAPEIARAEFEYSTDRVVWSSLGGGVRVPGGWELTGLSYPPDAVVRARGWVAGGAFNGSGWFLEAAHGPCYFVSQPAGRTNNAATVASFSALAFGSPPLAFQWFKNGVPLGDGVEVSGSTTFELTLSNVFGADAGSYAIVVSNSFGAVTSSVANLKVVDPYIQVHPEGASNVFGETVTFVVSVVGSAPLSYQWRKDWVTDVSGEGVSGELSPFLTITNLSGRHSGYYTVRITNSFGSAESLWANLTVADPIILSQPATVIAAPGQPAVFSVSALGSAPLTYAWRKNGVPLAGQAGAQLSLPPVQCPDGGMYDVVVSNPYGALTSSVAFLTIDANAVQLDPWNPGPANEVYSLAWLPGRKVLVGGGLFSTLGGQPRNYFGLLNSDGTLATSFNPGVSDYVYSMLVQPDGKIVLGGAHTLCRVNADGSLDPGFKPAIGSLYYLPRVLCMASQPDGKILVGGVFETLTGQTRYNIGRLNPDGSLDPAFNPGAGWLNCIAVQADGRILLGGPSDFRRLNPDGTADGTFKGGALGGEVCSLALQPDGKIIVAGSFTNLCGEARQNIGRVNPDGTLDPTFTATANDDVVAITLQADGRLLVSGSFTTLCGHARQYLGRLQTDGSLDCSFAPPVTGTWPAICSLATQPDGEALLGGSFSLTQGEGRSSLARLLNTEPATEQLSAAASTITWLRGGTCPEVVRAGFEVSTNDLDWTPLGQGERMAGGWQWNGPALPFGSKVRARGVVQFSGGLLGQSGSSSWLVETTAAVTARPVIITADDVFGLKTNQFQFTTRFSVGATCVVEASTNLLDWIPVQTNIVPPDGRFLLRDPETSRFPRRFYRVRN